jgi:diacylglycerol O-acyltransferase / wax synthase
LSPLDASFLAVESPTAHMHVGWATKFKAPEHGPRPTFAELQRHIRGRLCRDERFRQKLARVPLGLNAPLWTDDECFDVEQHVVAAESTNLSEVVDTCMSRPLDHDRPLWQICIAERLDDGGIGVVGKAHHCMVDGIAAVELMALLLDPTPESPAAEPDGWRPGPTPGVASRIARAVTDQLRADLHLARAPARLVVSPGKVVGLANEGQRALLALVSSLRPARPVTPLNEPISSRRHLALVRRSLGELKQIKEAFGVTINDVVLASAASGMRSLFEQRGQYPAKLKTMVPVNVRAPDEKLGNRISFMFVDLPCDEPDPVRRLQVIHGDTSTRKREGEPQGVDRMLKAVTYAPKQLQDIVSHIVASPRTFNLTVSNIPGPADPMYMLGCELDEAYPVVPLAERHALSIGVTTIRDRACFGLYADPARLPDADLLADAVDDSIDELLALSLREHARLN